VKAADVMQRGVEAVTAETSIEEAIRIMLSGRFSGVPVVDAQRALVGMLTEGDLLRRIETGTAVEAPAWRAWLAGPGRSAGRYVRTHARKVGEIMTTPVVSVPPDAELAEVVALMESRRIKRVPVVEGGRLAGIISRADLLRALERLLPSRNTPAVADAELRRRVLGEFEKERWLPRSYLDVKVENGMVELRGIVTDAREREAMRVLAENTPGTRGVVDHLVWIEPVSGMVLDTTSSG
jgi:CBS domain-containing protein